MKPQRIQRKRTKGWKMPANTVYVGRPSRWGNPFSLKTHTREAAYHSYRDVIYKSLIGDPLHGSLIKVELKGKNLACWCPIGESCHADILLEVAND